MVDNRFITQSFSNDSELHYQEKDEEYDWDFNKIKIGLRQLDDAVLNLSSYRKVNPNYGDKNFILRALAEHDYNTLRNISKYFFESSGIYQRMCKYLAYLYKYDYFVVPYPIKEINDSKNEAKLIGDFTKVLSYLDNSDVKRVFGNIALEVIVSGSYYGCILDLGTSFAIQQLPSEYCRSRWSKGADQIVELNMRFFDKYFPDFNYRLKILKLFPKDIQKAYLLFKEGKLPGDYPGDTAGWYMLEPGTSVKFNLNGSDFPILAGAIPSIIDLDAAQELDKKKTMQQLLKIIIQKLPLDKNGELIFDVDEARDIHNNAVAMLKRAVGVDVLTTFADIDVADMEHNNATNTDNLERSERTVFNNLGTSQNLFNSESNLAMEKSIANDEALMRDLLLQYERMLNVVVGKKFNRPAHYTFTVDILETTIYNYKDISKLYKEQTQLGYSKMLPQVALGHSQSNIIASANFENNVLKLSEIMIPPLQSSTMSGKDILAGTSKQSGVTKTGNISETGGRPEKSDEEKSDKTIANKESQG